MNPGLVETAKSSTPGWLSLAAAPVALLLAFVWFLTFHLRRRYPNLTLLWRGLGVACGTGFLWCGLQFLARFLVFEADLPLWLLSALTAVAAEVLAWLYDFERNTLPRSQGRLLLGLRLGALGMLFLVFVEPVHSTLLSRPIIREIAVLIDESQSMEIEDRRLSATEKLDRAEVFDLPALRDRLDVAAGAAELANLAAETHKQVTALSQPTGSQTTGVPDSLASLLDEVSQNTPALASRLETEQAKLTKLSEEVSKNLAELRKSLGAMIPGKVKAIRDGLSAGKSEAARKELEALAVALEALAEKLLGFAPPLDEAFLASLSEADRRSVDAAAARPRGEIMRQALARHAAFEDNRPLLEELNRHYGLRFYRFGYEPREITREDFDTDYLTASEKNDGSSEENPSPGETPLGSFVKETNISAALERAMEATSPESLAGVLLLTDGRHNSATPPEDALQQLALQHTPVTSLVVGSHEGPADISILHLRAPESIYLGDRVSVRAEVKADNLRGQRLVAVLSQNGKVADLREIEIEDVNFHTELRFNHVPEEKGIYDYNLAIEPLAAEAYQENNQWNFKVAVTDDRTNVLLVDNYPRWEFRYLRNLFYGRDKSVHLQYVLLTPDVIDRAQEPPAVYASARRKFGDAEATRLPENAQEWSLFDVIILGDVPPESLDEETRGLIREQVEKRGALLVLSSGPRYMPHAYRDESLRDLLPVLFESSDEFLGDSPEQSYHIELTTEGRTSPIMQQAASHAASQRIWDNLPALRWRFVPGGIKEGAEILAVARPAGLTTVNLPSPEAARSPDEVTEAIRRLATQKEFEKDHALVVTQSFGLGKVAMLCFDRTWRLRYGVGDTYHHRFWGQLVRWGAGESLRAGTELVRLGTDRLTYSPNDPIQVIAQVLTPERFPVTDGNVYIRVSRNNETVQRRALTFREGSAGIFETALDPLPEEGEYQFTLEGKAVNESLAESGTSAVDTTVLVETARNPVELAELTADRDFLKQAAQLTGGTVAEANETSLLPGYFGAPKETLQERRDVTLWDSWPFLVLFILLLTAEWLLRRRYGLS